MRTHLLPISALLFLSAPASAQLHAGEVPLGNSAVDVGIDLLLTETFTQAAAYFEIDCDDQPDIRAMLIHGAPFIDDPNIAMLHLLDDDLELCADLASFQRPKYYAFDQLLDCTGDFDWQSDSVNILGDFGSFQAIGPFTVDSMYVAYRRGTQVGWILLSFDLNAGLSARLKIHQVLPICPASTSIATHDAPATLSLFPNPSDGGAIHVECADALHSIELLDATGRLLARYNGTVRTIAAPEAVGAYLVRASYADGRRSITRLVRY
ncbi:MAG: hypothetical protein ABI432_06360 [Flavobacteriales bacterium]